MYIYIHVLVRRCRSAQIKGPSSSYMIDFVTRRLESSPDACKIDLRGSDSPTCALSGYDNDSLQRLAGITQGRIQPTTIARHTYAHWCLPLRQQRVQRASEITHFLHLHIQKTQARDLLGGFSLDYCYTQQNFQATSRVSIPHHTTSNTESKP